MATTTSPTLDVLIGNDPRALQVYLKARAGYNEHRLPHHDFLHILRDMHRALIIAEVEPSVDYGVLLPAVLLHDIGFFTPEYKTLGHDVTGARLAAEWLSEFGYSNAKIDAWYDLARRHGALGGKLMGAGGGGFLMFYCPASDRRQLREAMAAEGLPEMSFHFDDEGAKVLMNA